MNRRVLLCALLGALLLLSPPTAQAGLLLTGSGSGPVGSFAESSGTAGYGFTVGALPLEVSALGIWDPSGVGGLGLAEAHDVGLWDASGNLLASVTVAQGTGDPLVGEFRYHALASAVTLNPNQTYVLGALYRTPADGFRLDSLPEMASLFPAGVASFEQPRSFGAFDLHFPNPTLGTFSYVGPTLEFVDSAPEPASLMLAGLGVVGMLAYRCRRRAGALPAPNSHAAVPAASPASLTVNEC